jgi:hypothetical protein
MSNYIKILLGLLFTAIVFPLIGLLLYYFVWSFAPGSYARSEVYELNISEETLIEIIKEFKSDNPILDLTMKVKIPNSGEDYLVDGKSGHWHSFYFYYQDKNQIIHTWTRPHTKTSTSFAFDGINKGLVLGNWTNANASFWWWKNSDAKTEFEKRILINIK